VAVATGTKETTTTIALGGVTSFKESPPIENEYVQIVKKLPLMGATSLLTRGLFSLEEPKCEENKEAIKNIYLE